jgi:hypothetical protein
MQDSRLRPPDSMPCGLRQGCLHGHAIQTRTHNNSRKPTGCRLHFRISKDRQFCGAQALHWRKGCSQAAVTCSVRAYSGRSNEDSQEDQGESIHLCRTALPISASEQDAIFGEGRRRVRERSPGFDQVLRNIIPMGSRSAHKKRSRFIVRRRRRSQDSSTMGPVPMLRSLD